MSSYAAPIEVVQAALTRLGETITSLDDGSPAALVTAANYEAIIRANLAKHAWTFATRTEALTLVDDTVRGPWSFAYAPATAPTEIVNIRRVMYPGGYALRAGQFELQSGQILVRAEDNYECVVTARVNENQWADDFAEAIVTDLKGLYQGALLDRWQEGDITRRGAKMLMLEATVRDKRQQQQSSPYYNELAETWRGGARRG